MLRISVYTLTLIFLFLPSSFAFARQSNQFGLLGGINQSYVSSSPDEQYTGRMGLAMGGFWEHSFMELLGLSLEFYYLQKGGKRGTDNISVSLGYLEIPFLARLHLGSRRFGFVLFGGPSVSYLATSYGETEAGDQSPLTSVHNGELSIHSGASVEIPISNELSLTAGARYIQGLTNISRGTNTLTNQGILITAGIIFTDPGEENAKDLNSRAKEFLQKKFPDSAPPTLAPTDVPPDAPPVTPVDEPPAQ